MTVNFLAPELATLDLAALMQEALYEAEQAGLAGELPIGAVVVIDGQIIARGRAQHQAQRNQLRHAELNALLAGGEALWVDCERAILFTSAEPCPLCLGAAVMADVPHIIFAAYDEVVYSRQTVAENPYVRRHLKSYYGGVLEAESRTIIERFNPLMLKYITGGR